MLVPIRNTPRDYRWGSHGRISALLGVEPSGQLEAELWLGAHSGSPARIESGAIAHATLDAWLTHEPEAALGAYPHLPYLLKVLAAEAPLSLQVHPSRAHAALQFAAEDAAGIPRDADHRNYRDANHKPELILALEDGFVALCGIRADAERAAIVAELGLDDVLDPGNVAGVFADLLTHRDSDRVQALIRRTCAAASGLQDSRFAAAYRWVEELARHYPSDPGVVLSLFLNLVELAAGEALYLPAGNLHAYLSGIGIEVMAASDNVLRGGLTEKHIDIPELLAVATFTSLAIPRAHADQHGDASRFSGDAADFELWDVRGSAAIELHGPAIVLNLGTEAELVGVNSAERLRRGEARFVTADELTLQVTGTHVVLAQPQAGWLHTWTEHTPGVAEISN